MAVVALKGVATIIAAAVIENSTACTDVCTATQTIVLNLEPSVALNGNT